MIKANELRIGNLFMGGFDEMLEVTAIYNNGVDYKHVNGNGMGCCTYPGINPIQMTDKLLKRLGFTYCTQIGPNGQFYWDIWDSDRIISIAKYEEGFFFEDIVIDYKTYKTPLLYIHQLQNLYFALTGNQLTLNQI